MIERDCDKFKIDGAVLYFKDSRARQEADDAFNLATLARSEADTASKASETAQTLSENAVEKANNAQATADNAVSKADTAQSVANDAVGKADTAQTAVNSINTGFASKFNTVDGNLLNCSWCKRNGNVTFIFGNVKMKGQLLANTWTAVAVLPVAARPIVNVYTNVAFGNYLGLCQIGSNGQVQLFSQNAIGQNTAVFMTVSYPGTL